MNIKEFFKRDNLDEMQKQTLLKIESRGFWVLWVLLLDRSLPLPQALPRELQNCRCIPACLTG